MIRKNPFNQFILLIFNNVIILRNHRCIFHHTGTLNKLKIECYLKCCAVCALYNSDKEMKSAQTRFSVLIIFVCTSKFKSLKACSDKEVYLIVDKIINIKCNVCLSLDNLHTDCIIN